MTQITVTVTVDEDGTLLLAIPGDYLPLGELLNRVLQERSRPGEVDHRPPAPAEPPDAPPKRRPGKYRGTRDKLLTLMRGGDCDVRSLADQLGITRDGCTWHLRALRREGQVEKTGSGASSQWHVVRDT